MVTLTNKRVFRACRGLAPVVFRERGAEPQRKGYEFNSHVEFNISVSVIFKPGINQARLHFIDGAKTLRRAFPRVPTNGAALSAFCLRRVSYHLALTTRHGEAPSAAICTLHSLSLLTFFLGTGAITLIFSCVVFTQSMVFIS